MTDFELEEKLRSLVQKERRITQEILELIREAENRMLYAARGYPSLYEWLVKEFGFSQATAYRRVQAARLLREIPEAKEKMVKGDLNLTTVALLQSAVRKEERRIGERFDSALKRHLVAQIENKTPDQTVKILSAQFPEVKVRKESLRAVAAEHTRLTVTLEDAEAENLRRARELLAHSCQTWSEVVAWLVRDYLKKRDPTWRK